MAGYTPHKRSIFNRIRALLVSLINVPRGLGQKIENCTIDVTREVLATILDTNSFWGHQNIWKEHFYNFITMHTAIQYIYRIWKYKCIFILGSRHLLQSCGSKERPQGPWLQRLTEPETGSRAGPKGVDSRTTSSPGTGSRFSPKRVDSRATSSPGTGSGDGPKGVPTRRTSCPGFGSGVWPQGLDPRGCRGILLPLR